MSSIVQRVNLLNRMLNSSYLNLAVIGGGIATALAMHILFSAPELVDFREFRRHVYNQYGFYFLHDPFPPVRFLGGIIGGYIAGYLTRDKWPAAFINGLSAVILGVFIYYLGVVYDNITIFLITDIPFIDALLISTLQPLIFIFIPFSLLYFFQSIFTSIFGNSVAHILHARYPKERCGRSFEDGSWLFTEGLRSVIAVTILLLLFFIVWWFVFYFDASF